MWGLKKHYYILQSGSEGGSLTWFWKKQQLQDKNFIIKLHVSLPTLLRCLICWFSFMRTYQNHATVLNEKYWVNTFRFQTIPNEERLSTDSCWTGGVYTIPLKPAFNSPACESEISFITLVSYMYYRDRVIPFWILFFKSISFSWFRVFYNFSSLFE